MLMLVSLQSNASDKFPFLNINADIAYSPVFWLQQKQVYQGEFYPEIDGFVPIWLDINQREKLIPNNNHISINGRLGFQFWKQLYVGLRYSFLNIKGYSKPGITGGLFAKEGNTFFFFMSGQVGYIWQPFQAEAWSFTPLLGFGSYLGSEYYAGTGRKWQMNGQIKAQYLLNKKYGFFVAPGFTYWQYKDKGYSNYFARETNDILRLNSFQLEIGISFNFHLKMDDRVIR